MKKSRNVFVVIGRKLNLDSSSHGVLRRIGLLSVGHICLLSFIAMGCSSEPTSGEPTATQKSSLGTWNWSPKVCSWGVDDRIAVEISTDKWLPKDWTAATSTYAHHAGVVSRMLFNQNVSIAGLRFDRFETEPTYDYLKIDHKYGFQRLTGSSGGGDPTAPPSNGSHAWYWVNTDLQSTGYLDLGWYSDITINNYGYHIDEVLMLCDDTGNLPQNTREVQPNHAHDGFLLKTGDVIYVKVKQPPGHEMGIVVWPLSSTFGMSAPDIDVFGSVSDVMPNDTSEFGSVEPGESPELMVIPEHAGPTDRWIYLAIGAYDGGGHFRFYANIHSSSYNPTLTASTNWDPNPTQKELLRSILKKTSTAFYFATEGRVLIKEWNVHWDSGSTGLLRFKNDFWGRDNCSGRAGSGPCEGTNGAFITTSVPTWCGCSQQQCPQPETYACSDAPGRIERAAGTNAHELGHCYAGLWDEYENNHSCGHSIMGAGPYTRIDANIVDFCNERNGGRNWSWADGTGGHAWADNNWACMANALYPTGPPVPPLFPGEQTPDPFFKTTTHWSLPNIGVFDAN